MSLPERAAEAIGRKMCAAAEGFYDKDQWTRAGSDALAAKVDGISLAERLEAGDAAMRLLRLFAAVDADGNSDPDVWCEDGKWVQFDGKAHANPLADVDPEAAALLAALTGEAAR